MTKMLKRTRTAGRAMREARRRLGLAQLDLAQRVGCSEAQVTRIETGRVTAEQWLKEAIARELNIKTWEVGAGRGNGTNSERGKPKAEMQSARTGGPSRTGEERPAASGVGVRWAMSSSPRRSWPRG